MQDPFENLCSSTALLWQRQPAVFSCSRERELVTPLQTREEGPPVCPGGLAAVKAASLMICQKKMLHAFWSAANSKHGRRRPSSTEPFGTPRPPLFIRFSSPLFLVLLGSHKILICVWPEPVELHAGATGADSSYGPPPLFLLFERGGVRSCGDAATTREVL